MSHDEWRAFVLHGTRTAKLAEGASSWEPLAGACVVVDRGHPAPVDTARLEVARTIECDRVSVALDLARAGVGYALLPALAVAGDDVEVVGVEDLLPPRVVSVVWHGARRLPSVTASFTESIAQVEWAARRGDWTAARA